MGNEKAAKPDKLIRRPKQSRSIEMKEKILSAALQLFCEKGYYKTTTNEIAHRADVSIGSLYSYFKDKDTIFLEILERYHDKFDKAKEKAISNLGLLRTDERGVLRALIEALIKVHEESKELNRELTVLSYYNPEISKILNEQKEKSLQATVNYFIKFKDEIQTGDWEAIAIVIFDMISATVDRIVFNDNEIGRDRLINASIDLIYSYISR
jgi:AcrR family transcriptional regulator